MLPLAKLFQEVHRRGLWQATAAFLGMGWAVLEVMDLFTGRGLLPDWTFTGTLVVLALGFPVVLVTAFIQTQKDAADSDAAGRHADADTEKGVTEADSEGGPGAGAPAPDPEAKSSLSAFFTWKRAALGGVASFAILGLATSAFGIMRVTGIGAPGTLLAQGVLEEGGLLILADFESSAGTTAPSDLVTEALRIDLDQSPAFDLLDARAVATGLARMVRDPEEPFSEDLALELATREGAELVVSGDVGQVGDSYLLTGRLVNPQDGSVVVAFRETARDSDQLIDAIDALSGKIRSKIGEALSSVASSDPLHDATTTSLEALRKFTFVAQREPRGVLSGQRAIQIMEEAVALDTTFAEAYRYLSILIGNFGGSVQKEVDASVRAFRFRDRLPPRQQLLTEANYHTRVTGDYPQAARAYRGLLELDPSLAVAGNNLADIEMYAGNYAEAEALLRANPRPEDIVWSWNVMAVLAGQQKFAEAEEHLDRTVEAQPENVYLAPARAMFFASAGQSEKALAELEREASVPGGVEAWSQYVRVLALGRAGRVAEARQSLARLDDLAAEHLSPVNRLVYGTAGAFLSGWMEENPSRGIREMEALIDRLPYEDLTPVDRSHGWVALIHALMGAPAEARSYLEDYQAEVPSEGDPEGRANADVAEALSEVTEGASPESTGLVSAVETVRCFRCRHLYLGHGFEVAGDVERAIESYEAYLADGFFDAALMALILPTPVVHERLAALYETANDPEKAREHYEVFVEEWRDADLELQSRVEAAAARIVALGG